MFCYPVHFSHSWKILKEKIPVASFSEDTKVAGMGLSSHAKLFLFKELPLSHLNLAFPCCGSGCRACFRVFRVLLVDLPYVELLWRMIRALPYHSENCSINSWKFLSLSLLDSHHFFKVTTQPFSLFDCY